jgi:hypothetical protein
MKSPLTFIVGTAAAALLVAAVGASAHGAGPFFSRLTGSQGTRLDDNASGARMESPEPTESPEAAPSPQASPTAEPSEPPEASPSPEPTETPERESQSNDDDAEPIPAVHPSGDEDGGGGGD